MNEFFEQFGKRKRINHDATNEKELQNSQYIETENDTILDSEESEKNYDSDEDYSVHDSDEDFDEHPIKKFKVKDTRSLPISKIKSSNRRVNCDYCYQRNEQTKIYQGHPNDAVNENIALIDPKLHLFEDESFTHKNGQYPKTKLTYFR